MVPHEDFWLIAVRPYDLKLKSCARPRSSAPATNAESGSRLVAAMRVSPSSRRRCNAGARVSRSVRAILVWARRGRRPREVQSARSSIASRLRRSRPSRATISSAPSAPKRPKLPGGLSLSMLCVLFNTNSSGEPTKKPYGILADHPKHKSAGSIPQTRQDGFPVEVGPDARTSSSADRACGAFRLWRPRRSALACRVHRRPGSRRWRHSIHHCLCV